MVSLRLVSLLRLPPPCEVNFENFQKIHYGLVFSVKLLGCANFCPNRTGAFRVIPKTDRSCSSSPSSCDKAVHRALRWELKKMANTRGGGKAKVIYNTSTCFPSPFFSSHRRALCTALSQEGKEHKWSVFGITRNAPVRFGPKLFQGY